MEVNFRIIYLEEVTSTQDYIKDMPENLAEERVSGCF